MTGLDRYLGMEGLPLCLLHLWDGVLVLAVLAASAGIGSVLLGPARASDPSRADRFLLSVPLGAGLLATGILLLSSMGFARPHPLGLLLLGSGVLGWKGLTSLAKAGGGGGPGGGTARAPIGGKGFVLVAVLVGLYVLLQASGPPSDFDTLMYHLPIPYDIVDEGRLRMPEGNLHVAFVGLTHMLYLPLLAWGSPAAPALLSGAFALLLGAAVAQVGKRLLSPEVGVLAGSGLFGTGTILVVAVTARVDVTLSFFLFMAHASLLYSIHLDRGRGGLAQAGALLGMAVGVKYHALAYAAAALPLVLAVVLLKSRDMRALIRGVTVFAGASLLCAAPWLLKNYALFGAPFYPFLTERVLPLWLQGVTGGSGLPAGIDMGVFSFLEGTRASISLPGLFLAPGRMTTEAEGHLYRLSPLLLGLVFFPFVRRGRGPLLWLLLPPCLYLLAVLLPRETVNLRYLLPAVPALTLAAAVCTVDVLERVPLVRSRKGVALALLVVLALIPSAGILSGGLVEWHRWEHWFGGSSPGTYLSDHSDGSTAVHFREARMVSDMLPQDSKLLLLFEARTFYFAAEALPDNTFVNWPLAEAAGVTEGCLENTGITHVLLSRGTLEYLQRRGADPTRLGWDTFQSFRDRCLAPVYSGWSYDVFRVTPNRAVSTSFTGHPPPQSTSIPSG